MRSDIIKLYKDVHTWVGIVSGLALFIAFYAGAITMFELPLQRWASPPEDFGELTPLVDTPQLIDRVQAEYPEARRGYQIVLEPHAAQPARLRWQVPVPDAHDHDVPVYRHANLNDNGELVVSDDTSSPVGQLVDDLHRQVGLPFEHDISMPIMGIIAVLYSIALVSGVVVLFPTLIKDLFALRFGKNLKRMWLDFHNLLGIFSLPFHLIMALTAVPFAFHDQLYGLQNDLIFDGGSGFVAQERPINSADQALKVVLSPEQLLARLQEQAPDFQPKMIMVQAAPDDGAPGLRVFGDNPRYGMRSIEGGVLGLDPYTGEINATDYMPGEQSRLGASITTAFTLHFGTYGGEPIRWSYFFLGLAGAIIFYTGNLLWLESRRKKLRRGKSIDSVKQTRSSHVMGALTIGMPLGCIAGISLTIASAKLLPHFISNISAMHSWVYYLTFLAAIAWAFYRGVARGAVELLYLTVFATLMIPLASFFSLLLPNLGWNYLDGSVLVDVVAVLGSLVLFYLAKKTNRRINHAPEDSIWHSGIVPNDTSHTVVSSYLNVQK